MTTTQVAHTDHTRTVYAPCPACVPDLFVVGTAYTVITNLLCTAPSLASKPGFADLTLGTHVVIVAMNESRVVATARNTRTGSLVLLLHEHWIARNFRAVGAVLPLDDECDDGTNACRCHCHRAGPARRGRPPPPHGGAAARRGRSPRRRDHRPQRRHLQHPDRAQGFAVKDEQRQAVEALLDQGVTLADVIRVCAERDASAESRRLIQLARAQWHREGEIEIDEPTVVSGSDDAGDYVLAWVWVDAPSVDDPSVSVAPPPPSAELAPNREQVAR